MKQISLILTIAAGTLLQAQQPQIGVLYKCTNGQTEIKVTQCYNGRPELCDVELYKNGKPQPGMRLSRAGVNDLMKTCLGAGAPSSQSQQPAANGRAGNPAPANNTVRVGDTVEVYLFGDWSRAQIKAIDTTKNPNQFDVLLLSGQLHDQRYWVNAPQVRMASNTPAPKAGQPPKPGLATCGQKMQGRYSSGGLSNITITFRPDKTTVTQFDTETVECWIGGGTIYIRVPGWPKVPDMELEINDDGTLDMPLFGTLKKRSN